AHRAYPLRCSISGCDTHHYSRPTVECGADRVKQTTERTKAPHADIADELDNTFGGDRTAGLRHLIGQRGGGDRRPTVRGQPPRRLPQFDRSGILRHIRGFTVEQYMGEDVPRPPRAVQSSWSGMPVRGDALVDPGISQSAW